MAGSTSTVTSALQLNMIPVVTNAGVMSMEGGMIVQMAASVVPSVKQTLNEKMDSVVL